jgi:hypothetical protein
VPDKLQVDVRGGDIIVTMAGTTFKMIFQRFPIAPQLMANWYAPRGEAGGDAKRAHFLAAAWKLATAKARELRWIK